MIKNALIFKAFFLHDSFYLEEQAYQNITYGTTNRYTN